MVRLRPWEIAGVAAALAVLATTAVLWPPKHERPLVSGANNQSPYRTYTATGQVVNVAALGARGCTVQVRLHQWVSLSDGFALAEIPQRGQVYALRANSEQCMALEVALASLGNPDDLKSPRHIYYEAGQMPSGEWRMTKNPSAPLGCGGL